MKNTRLPLALLLGLSAGMAGETLLFLGRQSARVEQVLADDFRLILPLEQAPTEARRKVIEDQLRAIPEVADARYVSGSEAMAELRREDPELVETAGLLNDNPLPPSFELSLRDEGFGRVEAVAEQARALAGASDARYKPLQAQAVLQARFYERLVDVCLSVCLCLATLMAVLMLWVSARPGRLGLQHEPWKAWTGGLGTAAAGAAGAAASAAALAALALPLRAFAPWWSWPSSGRQAALVGAAAILGWVLCGFLS